MPRGPRGEKRPADVIGNAVRIMQIATGDVEEIFRDPGKDYAHKGGVKGGAARAIKLSKKRKIEIAKEAAQARWSKRKD